MALTTVFPVFPIVDALSAAVKLVTGARAALGGRGAGSAALIDKTIRPRFEAGLALENSTNMATWSDDIEIALGNLGGIATLGAIYEEIKKIRLGPYPKALKATVRGAIERNSSDSKAFSSNNDLFFSVHGLGAGIWGLRNQLKPTPVASDIGQLPLGAESPERIAQTMYRILRDTELARKIKLLHKDVCQLCETKISLYGKSYSEAHHIKPLGTPHFGPDIPENIIVVCPNCHVTLDYFVAPLEPARFRTVAGHVISSEFIAYHNRHVGSVL